jgi:penicillin amidase
LHTEVPVLVERFEPWHPLAAQRTMNVTSLSLMPELPRLLQGPPVADEPPKTRDGSNVWAIAPERSATGNAMLFINPHIPLNEIYEGHLCSEEGWNFSGGTAYGGFPFPIMGHNEHLGWSLTVNYPDIADVFLVTFDHPRDPLKYRYDGGWRNAVEWEESFRIAGEDGVREQVLTLRKTHHGPVVMGEGERRYAVSVPRLEKGGLLRQWYEMGKAQSLEEFQRAVGSLSLVFHNIVYADVEGHIWYVYNAAIPRRDISFDWTQPVDGSDPRTEWRGLHSLDELPQVLDPESGYVQNCNSSPFTTTAQGENPNPQDYPTYVARRDQDDNRVRISKRILTREELFTFDDWSAAAWDTQVIEAESWIPRLERALTASRIQQSVRADLLAGPMEALGEWDQRCAVDSVATTLFMLWYEMMLPAFASGAVDDDVALDKLEYLVQNLESRFGSWEVPFGDLNRHQRPDDQGNFPGDSAESFPTAGGHALAGMIFTFLARTPPGSKLRYGYHGHSYVSVVEFDPEGVRARSMVPYGQSRDPASPHYLDQAPMYARGEFKPAWFELEEVLKNLERSYHPGE